MTSIELRLRALMEVRMRFTAAVPALLLLAALPALAGDPLADMIRGLDAEDPADRETNEWRLKQIARPFAERIREALDNPAASPEARTRLRRVLWEGERVQLSRADIRLVDEFKTDGGRVLQAEFSKDGRVIASVGECGDLLVRDTTTGAILARIDACLDFRICTAIAFDKESRRLAVVINEQVRIWDWQAGSSVSLACDVARVLWSPGGTHILGIGWNKAEVWDVEANAACALLEHERLGEASATMDDDCVTFDLPEGQGTWNWKSGESEFPEALARRAGNPEEDEESGEDCEDCEMEEVVEVVPPVRVSDPIGGNLAILEPEGGLLMCRPGEPDERWFGHRQEARQLAFSPDGSCLAVSGGRSSFRTREGQTLTIPHDARAVAPGRRGSEICTIDASGIYAWDGAGGGTPMRIRSEGSSDGGRLALSADGRHLTAIIDRFRLTLPTDAGDACTPEWWGIPTNIAWSSQGRLAIAFRDGTRRYDCEGSGILVLNSRGEKLSRRTVEWMDDWKNALAWSPDGTTLAWSDDDSIHVSGAFDLEDIRTLPGPSEWIAFVDDTLALSLDDRVLTLWHLPDWTVARRRVLSIDSTHRAALSPDGKRFAVSSDAGVQVYEIRR